MEATSTEHFGPFFHLESITSLSFGSNLEKLASTKNVCVRERERVMSYESMGPNPIHDYASHVRFQARQACKGFCESNPFLLCLLHRQRIQESCATPMFCAAAVALKMMHMRTRHISLSLARLIVCCTFVGSARRFLWNCLSSNCHL